MIKFTGEGSMKKRIVDQEITLIPYYPDYETALQWYQDPEVCKQVDNVEEAYSPDKLKLMYSYLSTHGDCYYIQYKDLLVGDVTLKNDGEISIVICKEAQNRHIGRRCIQNLIEAAKEKGMTELKAQIYSFNEQSKKMFSEVGFQHLEKDWYIYSLSQ